MVFWRSLLVTTVLVLGSGVVHAQEGSTGIRMVESAPTPVSPWAASFYSLASAPMNQVGENASVFTYNYLALNYKFNKTQRVSVRPVFQYTAAGKNSFGQDNAASLVLGDAHIVYSDYEIATLGPANVSTSFKFYLPTSESSQSTGMILKFRPETFITLSVGRFDTLTYALKPDFFVQSRSSNFNAKGEEKMTNVFALEHYIEYGLSLNKTFTLKPAAGFLESWSNPSENPDIISHRTDGKIALGLDIAVMKGLNFALSAENKFSLTDRPKKYGENDVAIMRPNETNLLLITTASL